MTASTPKVELLWWRECPSWERTLAMLRDAMTELGLDPDTIGVREIETDEDANRESFPGSPTIRVDGRDIQPPSEGEPSGLTCRVYRHRDGAVSPLPEMDDIRDALREASERKERVS